MVEQNDEHAIQDRTIFRVELEALINKHSIESLTGTPDFVLADYLIDSLDAFQRLQTRRKAWYADESEDPSPES